MINKKVRNRLNCPELVSNERETFLKVNFDEIIDVFAATKTGKDRFRLYLKK